MFTRTKKPRSAGQTVASRAAAAEHKRFTYSWQESTAFRLHGANTGPLTEAERRPDEIDTNWRRAAGLAPGHDFSVIPVFAKPPAEGAARELVVKGPHTSPEVSTAPLHDDGYSRKDDQGNHTIHDNYFLGSDNPGPKDLDKDDVIKYSFTAEQRIIDTSDGDKVIKTLGPYTAGINGKHPRTPWGVPKMIGK